MGGVFLTCCLAAFAVTRHFTPGLGDVIAWMLAAGLFLGGFLVLANLLYYPVRELVVLRADEGADRRARRG
jgi:hypothetical protein